jgi:hypothetical protein
MAPPAPPAEIDRVAAYSTRADSRSLDIFAITGSSPNTDVNTHIKKKAGKKDSFKLFPHFCFYFFSSLLLLFLFFSLLFSLAPSAPPFSLDSTFSSPSSFSFFYSYFCFLFRFVSRLAPFISSCPCAKYCRVDFICEFTRSSISNLLRNSFAFRIPSYSFVAFSTFVRASM